MNKSVDTKDFRLTAPTEKPKTEMQLMAEIEKAEEGPFLSVVEGMKDFEQWLQTRKKK